MLLNTKFFIPPLRPDHIPRSELLVRLREGSRRRLTLITAPAGFGKSTAVAELFAAVTGSAERLSLDPTDNAPNRFWTYFGHGLARLFEGLGAEATATLSSASPPAIREVQTLWLNELAARADERPALLALDDFHLVDHPGIATDLAYLIDHLAPNLRLILATRQRPDLPLARWRGRGQICHLVTRDLLLSRVDSEKYLSDRLGPTLSPDQATRLFERCEGWPAALQLAASWLAGRPSTDALIRELPARGDLANYMAEEILAHMSPEIGDRLMHLSILDAFNGPLCAAVLGPSQADGLLDVLEASNLPLVQLDGEGYWLRFHHLFRDFLRRRLNRVAPESATDLHIRACDYFSAQAEWQLAFHHARAAGDLDRSIELLTRSASSRINRGESRALLQDVESLAVNAEQLPADLLIEVTKASYIVGRTEDCRANIAILERLADKGLLEPQQTVLLQVQRAALARSRDGDLKAAIRELSAALESLPEDQRSIRPWVAVQLGVAHTFAFELDSAEKILTGPESKGLAGESDPVPIFSRRANLAQIHWLRGDLRQAADLCNRILALREEEPAPLGSPGLSLTFRVLGAVELQRGRFESSRTALEQAIHCGKLSGFDELVAFPLLGLAELARTVGDGQQLDLRLEQAEHLKHRGNLAPAHHAWLRALHLHRLLDSGDVRGAERLARRFPLATGPPSMVDDFWRIAWVRAQTSFGRQEEATQAISWHLQEARRQGRTGMEIELRVWSVWQKVHFGRTNGRHRAELDRLCRRLAETLELAADQGNVRPFLTPPLTELTGLLDRLGPHDLSDGASKFCRRIETVLRERASQGLDQPVVQGPKLTGKENEVLAGLAEGRSNAQIAGDLGVAVSTVKTHLKNLFYKLGARRRTQAVARARELGCL